jgi:hypothetical protein
VKGLSAAYESYLAKAQTTRDDYANKKRSKKDPSWKEKLHARLLEAELFDQTHTQIDDLYGLLYR